MTTKAKRISFRQFIDQAVPSLIIGAIASAWFINMANHDPMVMIAALAKAEEIGGQCDPSETFRCGVDR